MPSVSTILDNVHGTLVAFSTLQTFPASSKHAKERWCKLKSSSGKVEASSGHSLLFSQPTWPHVKGHRRKVFRFLSSKGTTSAVNHRSLSCRVLAMQTQQASQEAQLQESELSDQELLDSAAVPGLVRDALVWCSLHGLLVGDKESKSSGTAPGVGLVHAPVSLLPTPFPR
jgi:hypothetical protein